MTSYLGILKLIQGCISVALIISATVIDGTFRTSFVCGLAIFGLLSAVVLLILNMLGTTKKCDWPWLWIELICSVNMILLYAISSTIVLCEFTKAAIILGILGYIALTVYIFDVFEHLKEIRTPRSRYVWTVPNMPEPPEP
ncbi:uncharacterized protein LOC143203228 isoform X2 [Rhynchophorus ferrugineus]